MRLRACQTLLQRLEKPVNYTTAHPKRFSIATTTLSSQVLDATTYLHQLDYGTYDKEPEDYTPGDIASSAALSVRK